MISDSVSSSDVTVPTHDYDDKLSSHGATGFKLSSGGRSLIGSPLNFLVHSDVPPFPSREMLMLVPRGKAVTEL
eukprot:g74726.t1